jgi:hypothetical protein
MGADMYATGADVAVETSGDDGIMMFGAFAFAFAFVLVLTLLAFVCVFTCVFAFAFAFVCDILALSLPNLGFMLSIPLTNTDWTTAGP